MAQPRVIVLRAAGINCDEETVFAWHRAGADCDLVHVKQLIAAPNSLDRYQLLTIPGGFSYGDDIASGKLLANQLNHHLGDQLRAFVERGGLVLGICNGFQVLVRMGLLPGDDCGVRATLALNASGRYEDRWVRLRATENCRCEFVEPGEEFDLPVGHGEGRLVFDGDEDSAKQLRAMGRIALEYISLTAAAPAYPENPNGSIGNAAALTDATGRVFGLMPHPDRHLFATQSPEQNRDFNAETAGARFFRRVVERLR